MKELWMNSQIDFPAEAILDSFAGGGGASTGIELAAGRPVNWAINHDPDAILLHKSNHPYTEHFRASVWDVDPLEVAKGSPVGLAWFSPDCKHFSKAKGAALRDRKIRGLAWIVLRWAGTVRPRVIMLENVEEFKTWGPVRKGKPVKKHAGKTFCRFIQQLEDLGYTVEYRELVAADYGAPTTRKRFVLVARCDGKPIVWPERTHAPRDSEEVKSGRCKPWRSAAEIIDWSLPSYSIFDTKQEIKEKHGVNAVRPLAKNTLRRVIRGVDKFTIRSGKPFIVPMGYGERKGQAPRVMDIQEPVGTVVARDKFGICEPVVSPFMAQQKFNNEPQDITRPLTTVTAVGSHEVVNPVMVPFTFSNTGDSVGSAANGPVHTIRSAGGQVLSAASLIQYHTEQRDNVRGQGMTDPIQTVDAANRYGLTCANLVEYYGNGNPLNPNDTLNTITAQGLEYAECRTMLAKAEPGRDLGRWPEVRKLLNEFCGYSLRDDEVLLLIIRGVAYYICDITLRMLTPRELYNAMGFPEDYIIDRDYLGNEYPKAKQVARCGNAVCPPLAEAMVRANLPEWCGSKISTMKQLDDIVAC